MEPQGKRFYHPEYDRGVILKSTTNGETVHRYVDEPGVWRNAHGKIIEELQGREVYDL
jgi:hypothetical protein